MIATRRRNHKGGLRNEVQRRPASRTRLATGPRRRRLRAGDGGGDHARLERRDRLPPLLRSGPDDRSRLHDRRRRKGRATGHEAAGRRPRRPARLGARRQPHRLLPLCRRASLPRLRGGARRYGTGACRRALSGCHQPAGLPGRRERQLLARLPADRAHAVDRPRQEGRRVRSDRALRDRHREPGRQRPPRDPPGRPLQRRSRLPGLLARRQAARLRERRLELRAASGAARGLHDGSRRLARPPHHALEGERRRQPRLVARRQMDRVPLPRRRRQRAVPDLPHPSRRQRAQAGDALRHRHEHPVVVVLARRHVARDQQGRRERQFPPPSRSGCATATCSASPIRSCGTRRPIGARARRRRWSASRPSQAAGGLPRDRGR